MTIGLLFEVPESAADRLRDCVSLADWYDALGDLAVDECASLDAEDSLAIWAELLAGDSALGTIFTGLLSSPSIDSNDPVVRYITSAMARAAADELAQLPKPVLEARLGSDAADSWLQQPLIMFLSVAARNGNGVVLMWGG